MAVLGKGGWRNFGKYKGGGRDPERGTQSGMGGGEAHCRGT